MSSIRDLHIKMLSGFSTTLRADPFREPQEYESPSYGASMNARPLPELYQNFAKTMPTPDNRYSDYASQMSDGRLVTDYRPNCSTRAPYGHQNATKAWLIENSEEVARVSRMRQATYTGAVYGARYVGPKPAAVQTCTAYGCKTETYDESANRLGKERMNASAAPEDAYPGTFDPTSVFAGVKKSSAHIQLTRRFEGGRNTASRKAIDNEYTKTV